MRVVAYVRGRAAVAAADEQAVREWANASGHRVVDVAHDLEDAPLRARFGLAGALGSLQERRADAIAVARADRLGADLVEQELLAAEIARAGGAVCSAASGESTVFEQASGERAVARTAIKAVAEHRDAMRDLSARARVGRIPPEDREHASLARIEQLAELGLGARDIARALSGEGFAPRWSRVFSPGALRRLIAERRAATP